MLSLQFVHAGERVLQLAANDRTLSGYEENGDCASEARQALSVKDCKNPLGRGPGDPILNARKLPMPKGRTLRGFRLADLQKRLDHLEKL